MEIEMRLLRTCALALLAVASVAAADDRSMVADRVMRLTRDSAWTRVAAVPVGFRTFHPQGMVRIGDAIFVSSVEVTKPTVRFPAPVDGYDRDTGAGIGHLFKMDLQGRLLADLVLAEGAAYHPGGIDYDGTAIWVPLSEYRPNSHSIVYKVDPATMKATEVLRVADSIGGIVHNTDDRTLHGVSWGSRRFYRWSLDVNGRAAATPVVTDNTSHYIDYQDCKYVGDRRMLCSGLAEFRQTAGAAAFRLGGLDLISLADGRPLHQVPVPLWTDGGTDMTHNPVWIEATSTGLRAYFMPEDDRSTVYIYEVQ